jgi:hypothetical protein
MRRMLLAILFFVSLLAIWNAIVRSVILNGVKDLSQAAFITQFTLACISASIVRSLAPLGMTSSI